jgi:hypothetical protein
MLNENQRIQKECLEFVSRFFNWEIEKIIWWWSTKNPHLGEVSPLELVKMGKAQKVYSFIVGAIESNQH